MNPDRGGRPLPSNVKQQMRRQAYGRQRYYDDDDDYERRRYRPARQYNRYPHYSYPY